MAGRFHEKSRFWYVSILFDNHLATAYSMVIPVPEVSIAYPGNFCINGELDNKSGMNASKGGRQRPREAVSQADFFE